MFTNKGFTLIELLVVVLIIGILAAIAVPKYQYAVLKSQYSTIKELTNSIAQAEDVYYLANGSYTDNFNDLDIAMPGDRLDGSTTRNYIYSWGRCEIYVSGFTYAQCFHTKASMSYQIFSSSSGAKSRFCVAWGANSETDIQSKICQSETGKTTPHATETGFFSNWQY